MDGWMVMPNEPLATETCPLVVPRVSPAAETRQLVVHSEKLKRRRDRRKKSREMKKQKATKTLKHRRNRCKKLREMTKQKATNDDDIAFARAATVVNKAGQYPHLEWIGDSFCPSAPQPQPVMELRAYIMHDAHATLGVHWKGSRKGPQEGVVVKGLADTGCQTCTAGVDFLETIGCPRSYLIPTRHRIVGITNDNLGIIGALFVRFELNGKVTRQMVYVSTKVKGLFLSEGSLKVLGIIDQGFPKHDTSMTSTCCRDEEESVCKCPLRGGTPDRPVTLPMPATSENVEKLRQWLVDTFSATAFNQCDHQQIPELTGTPMDIKVKKDETPIAVYTPIPVAHHWKKQVKADIDRDVRLGIIEQVPQGTQTTWCSRMVVTPKSNGSPRRTVDLQRLNKATLRETHHTPTPFNIVSSVPPNKYKTVLDAWNGYHSLPLNPDAREKTTFVTEWGRYRYRRAPMGFHASGDAYTRRWDDITSDQEKVMRCVDDSIMWDDDVEAAFWHTFDYLKICADNGVVFNEKKFKFAQENVEFAGF